MPLPATTRSSLLVQELVLALALRLQVLAQALLPASALLALSALPAASAQRLFSLLAWLPLVLQLVQLAWPPP